MVNIPVVSLDAFLRLPSSRRARADCVALADALVHTGLVFALDPRAKPHLNRRYLDMMTAFYRLDAAVKARYAHPELSHQTGWTPPYVETARDHRMVFIGVPSEHRPVLFEGGDPKERWFTPTPDGERATQSASHSDAIPIVPDGFPDWLEVAGGWYAQTKATVLTCLRMLAIGMRLPDYAFLEYMHQGPHLLSSTGTDLTLHGSAGKGVARVHYDLNAITAHSEGSCPGFYAWTRNLERFPVRIPPNLTLLQAARQLSYLTGGAIHYGLHEVVVTQEALEYAQRQRDEGFAPWRVSCNLFMHAATATTLQPLGAFATDVALQIFPPISTAAYLEQELHDIGLARA